MCDEIKLYEDRSNDVPRCITWKEQALGMDLALGCLITFGNPVRCKEDFEPQIKPIGKSYNTDATADHCLLLLFNVLRVKWRY